MQSADAARATAHTAVPHASALHGVLATHWATAAQPPRAAATQGTQGSALERYRHAVFDAFVESLWNTSAALGKKKPYVYPFICNQPQAPCAGDTSVTGLYKHLSERASRSTLATESSAHKCPKCMRVPAALPFTASRSRTARAQPQTPDCALARSAWRLEQQARFGHHPGLKTSKTTSSCSLQRFY